MKKQVKFLLALAIFLTSGITASAQRINYPEDNADVRVEGTIGSFDPGNPDPEGGEPPVTEWWLDVSLPTHVTFFSDQTDFYELTSPDFDIHNYSARGVDVAVKDFTADTNSPAFYMIGLLNIVSDSQSVQLIEDGLIDVTSGSLLVEMERQISRTSNDSGGYDVEPRVASFGFEGELDSIPTLRRVDFDLTLGFEVNLDR